jgi:outer membrane protein TolC
VQDPTLCYRAAFAATARFSALTLVFFSAICAPLAQGAETPLTLTEAQRLAVARSRQIVTQDAVLTAWSLTRDFMTMTSVGVMQEFTRAEKREARAQRYEREADKALAEKDSRVASIQRDTALAWLDRYYAEAMAGVVAEQSAQARVEIEAAETAYRAGRGNLADVVVARSALVSLDDRASEMGRRVSAAKIVLARWIGSDAGAPLADKPAIDSIRLDSQTLDEDLEHHPQITILARQEAVAAAEVKIAQANKKPDWSVALMYSQRGSAYSNLVSLNVSVPLQWDQANRQDREVAAKLAMLDQARAEREDMLRAHIAEVRAMFAEWKNDRERGARYARELLPLTTERTQATLAAYRGGKASITDVLIARRSEIDVRLQALQLEMDAARLWAQLNFIIPDDGRGTHVSVSGRSERP